MKCPICGEPCQRVLETRAGRHGTTRRVRVCQLGHRYATVEVHEPVFCSAKQRAKDFAATSAVRVALRRRDMLIAAELHRGWERLAAAHGIDRSAVYVAAQRGRRYINERRQAEVNAPDPPAT